MKSWKMDWPRSRIRAISPVISTVLMIGLVVVAGLGVALVIFGTAGTPAPIGVDVLGISEFETTDNNILVDRFTVTLENTERSIILIQKVDAIKITFGDPDRTPVPGWRLNLTQDLISLGPLENVDLPVAIDPSVPNAIELVPENDTIYVYVTVYPEGSKFTAREANVFQSDLLAVEDTFGPVMLFVQTTPIVFDNSGSNLSLNIVNNGSTNLDLLLKFNTDTSALFFTINGKNTTQHSFFLQKYQNTSLPGINISVKPFPASATSGTMYPILIELKDQKILKSWKVMLFATYQL